MKSVINYSLGYDPDEYSGMTYNIWAQTFGKYRWYHEDGSPRTQYPLDYNWKTIYEIATNAADLAFSYRIIDDPFIFTNEFLANVPINWLRYKTQLELFSGTLDGTTISPDLFEQGFTRELNIKDNTNGSGSTSESLGERTDSTSATRDRNIDAKARSINYEQGVQAYDNLNNENIGELGNSYASGFNDSVSKTTENSQDTNTTVIGEQNNTQNVSSSVSVKHSESERVKRINYYDNLAFLRDRMDRLNLIKPFQYYFEYLFNHVSSMTGFWK